MKQVSKPPVDLALDCDSEAPCLDLMVATSSALASAAESFVSAPSFLTGALFLT